MARKSTPTTTEIECKTCGKLVQPKGMTQHNRMHQQTESKFNLWFGLKVFALVVVLLLFFPTIADTLSSAFNAGKTAYHFVYNFS
jgi:hypothetical protein